MSRVFVTMLAYNSPEMIRSACENFDKSTSDIEHRFLIKTIFDCGFPIGNREENTKKNKQTAVYFSWWHTEIPNEGVLSNHNRVIHDFYRMQKNDWYAIMDPDSRISGQPGNPHGVGWITSAVEALQSDESAVFCSLAHRFHTEKWCADAHGREESVLSSGLKIARYKQLMAWPSGVWRGEWLAARPRHHHADHPWYGYAEHCDIKLMNEHKKTWLSLVDYFDDGEGVSVDPLYAKWKVACAQWRTFLKFDDWLKLPPDHPERV